MLKKKTDKLVPDNAEICSDDRKGPLRTGLIRKSIRRTLNTAQFETLVIEDYIEEKIEWRDLAERQTKENNWTTILITQFKQTHDRVLNELGLSEKKAFFGKVASDSAERYKKHRAVAEQNPNDLEDLDALDALGI